MRPGIEFDDGRFPRAKLGFVLLSSEQTIESESGDPFDTELQTDRRTKRSS